MGGGGGLIARGNLGDWGDRGRSSVPLPPLHRHQGRFRWRRSVHEGCGRRIVLVRVCVLSPGRGPRGAPWDVLVLQWAVGGENRQARGPGLCAQRLAEVPGGAGGMTARGRVARGLSGVPGATLGPGCRDAASLLAGGHPGGEGGAGGGPLT